MFSGRLHEISRDDVGGDKVARGKAGDPTLIDLNRRRLTGKRRSVPRFGARGAALRKHCKRMSQIQAP